MLPTTPLRPWTFATAENGERLTHTWIRDWATDRDRIHTDAAAAGWQSHCLLDVYDHSLLRTLTVTASSRDKLVNPRREPHILITVAPHIPWTLQPLPQLASMGRASPFRNRLVLPLAMAFGGTLFYIMMNMLQPPLM